MKIISFLLAFFLIFSVSFAGCASLKSDKPNTLTVLETKKNDYATEFEINLCEGGYKLITLGDGSKFLIVPEDKDTPDFLESDITVIKQPLENIYLAASAVMCLFDSLERLDSISFSSIKEENWYVENAKKAMKDGKIVFAGKYSEPDFELLTSKGCSLAIESLMIGHSPEIKGELEALNIPVFVDQSSNESHPLGRSEWIKVYGCMLGEEEKAEKYFDEQKKYLKDIEIQSTSENGDDSNAFENNKKREIKRVSFFYVSSGGGIITRKSSDYVSSMIELAGGEYIFEDLDDVTSKTSTITLDPEYFYSKAKDCDVIIYNAAVDDKIKNLEQLLLKFELLRDFEAVKKGNVWCTEKSMYQEMNDAGLMIKEMHDIFTFDDKDADLSYFYRLK